MGYQVVGSGTFRALMNWAATHYVPAVLSLEITADCNALCPFCLRPVEDRRSRKMLPFSKIRQILDEVRELGGLFLEITGGEPLLHPAFEEIVCYARGLGFAVAVTTNGMLLNADHIDLFSAVGMYNVLVSVHAVDKVIYQKMFGVRSTPTHILNAIQEMVRRKIPVQVSFTATRLNIDHFGEVREALMELGLRAEDIAPTIMHERADGNNLAGLAPTEDQIINLYLRFPEYLRSRKKLGVTSLTCVAGRSLAAVDFEGNVHPCTLFEFPVGNVFQSSFRAIWENAPALKNIRRLRGSDFAQCLHCEALEYCEICIARNYAVNRNLLSSSLYNCRESFAALRAAQLLEVEDVAKSV